MFLANEFDDPNLNNTDNIEDVDRRMETLWELMDKCDKELSSIELKD